MFWLELGSEAEGGGALGLGLAGFDEEAAGVDCSLLSCGTAESKMLQSDIAKATKAMTVWPAESTPSRTTTSTVISDPSLVSPQT